MKTFRRVGAAVARVVRRINRGFIITIHLRWLLPAIALSWIVLAHTASAAVYEPTEAAQQVITQQPILSRLQPVQEASEVYLANDYAWGNCTYFVASNVVVPANLGNADTWAVNAAADGYTVSLVPKVGAVAQSSTDSYLGHVAIVDAVSGDRVLVSEMNVEGLGIVDQAWYPVSFFQYIYF